MSLESHLPDLMFWSDASDQGWGATLADHFPSGLWPSCVENQQQFARAAGFSYRVAKQLSCSRRKASLAAYQSKWLLYRKWCWDKGHSSSNPSVPIMAEFLLWL